MKRTVTLVVPAFNEMANVARMAEEVGAVATVPQAGDVALELLFVDDGSSDQTIAAIERVREQHPFVGYVKLSRNCGHQAALMAGLQSARGDIVITLDADLQHPPAEIPQMLRAHDEGYDVVQMVRKLKAGAPSTRKGLFSWTFYKVMRGACHVDIVPNASDFRLMSRRAVDQLLSFPERRKFLRGLIPMLGYRQTTLFYEEAERYGGVPKYTWKKSLKLGLEALFSFSDVPLQAIFVFGLLIAMFSFLFGIGHIVYKFATVQKVVPGFTDIIVSVLFLSGCILLSLGVIGRYLMLILDQIRGRPEFIIERVLAPSAKP